MFRPFAGASQRSQAHMPTKMSTIIGTPTAHHARKSTPRPRPSGRRKKPMATTLVAVPIGVAMPPTLAPKATASKRAVAYGDLAKSAGAPRAAAKTETIPTATGHIIAAAAALLIHI